MKRLGRLPEAFSRHARAGSCVGVYLRVPDAMAEVLHMAIRRGPHGPAGDLPERSSVVDHSRE